VNLETSPFGSGEAFHALAGGRRGRFSLRTSRGAWPVGASTSRDFGLVGARALPPGQRHDEQEPVRSELVRRVQVEGQRALLLRVAGYPDGGVHGGHLAVVWNQGADGYALSIHPGERSRLGLEQHAIALLRAAAAMSRCAAVTTGAPGA
jgi:hypothetical protein